MERLTVFEAEREIRAQEKSRPTWERLVELTCRTDATGKPSRRDVASLERAARRTGFLRQRQTEGTVTSSHLTWEWVD